jgi:hypothetical protein
MSWTIELLELVSSTNQSQLYKDKP